MKPKSFYAILIAIPLVSLLAASCGDNRVNTLNRPSGEQVNTNNNSNTDSNANTNSVSQSTNTNSNSDNGQVAGAQTLPTKNIKVNDVEVNVEIADTDDARVQGLSDREKLDDGKGMLFDFLSTDFRKPGFWMKDMNFPIDIIWINNGKVIGVNANTPLPPANGDLPVYYPPSDITQALEVPAGWAAKNNIKVGSQVNL